MHSRQTAVTTTDEAAETGVHGAGNAVGRHWSGAPREVADQLKRVRAELLSATEGDGIRHPRLIGHLLRAEGNMLRPQLVLGTFCAFTEEVTRTAIQAAASVELLHVATLHHDDVMDAAVTRRGRKSVNVLWGNINSILAGDILLARAFALAAPLGNERLDRISKTLVQLCQGQISETDTVNDARRTVGQYHESVLGKTASLLSTACWLGAREGGASIEEAEFLHKFGLELGVAFQVVDDILDLYGREDVLGKPLGGDIQAGVYTLPLILAVEQDPELSQLLRRDLTQEEISRIIRHDSVVAGAVRATAIALGHMNMALTQLEYCSGRPQKLMFLAELSNAVMERLGVSSLPPPTGPAHTETLYSLRGLPEREQAV